MASDNSWERIDATDWPLHGVEVGGSTTAKWLVEPDTEVLWLHKDVVVKGLGPQGEDWAEFIATQVGEALGVPCAEVRLCIREGRRGSLSRSLVPRGFDFNEGGMTLETEGAPGYFRNADGGTAVDPARPSVQRPGHNLTNIQWLLRRYLPPEQFAGPQGCDAFDAFAGMLILDALIANRDRHEQNWAVLRARTLGPKDRLAPSYDHGGSLGYNLTDGKRRQLLGDEGALRAWAQRGTAWRFEHVKPPRTTLVQLAGEAVRACRPAAQDWWRERLSTLDLAPLRANVVNIPELSVPASRFAIRLLEVNLERLRDELGCS